MNIRIRIRDSKCSECEAEYLNTEQKKVPRTERTLADKQAASDY